MSITNGASGWGRSGSLAGAGIRRRSPTRNRVPGGAHTSQTRRAGKKGRRSFAILRNRAKRLSLPRQEALPGVREGTHAPACHSFFVGLFVRSFLFPSYESRIEVWQEAGKASRSRNRST